MENVVMLPFLLDDPRLTIGLLLGVELLKFKLALVSTSSVVWFVPAIADSRKSSSDSKIKVPKAIIND